MRTQLRWAGAGMAIAAILFFIRMAPVLAVLPEDMSFPPGSTEDLVRLAEVAGARWPISHVMGLIGVALFIAGYWTHARALAVAGHRTVGYVALAVAALGFGLFSVALIIDGFLVPSAAMAHLAGGAGAPALTEVQAVHDRALIFFTPGVFLMFVAMGVLSSRMLHGFIHSRWLGGLGMLIAITAVTAYFFGVTGPNWNNLRVGGSLMMIGFLWHLAIGVAALFGRGVRT